MRVLLDEQLDHRHRHDFGPDFEVTTVGLAGWKGIKNGTLLKLAEQQFDAFVTMDKGIEHQQSWTTVNLRIVVISARSNRYADVKPLIGSVVAALQEMTVGQLVTIR